MQKSFTSAFRVKCPKQAIRSSPGLYILTKHLSASVQLATKKLHFLQHLLLSRLSRNKPCLVVMNTSFPPSSLTMVSHFILTVHLIQRRKWLDILV